MNSLATRRVVTASALLLAGVGVSLAHHGWSWTESGFFQLKGVIAEAYLGNPHATLDVDVNGETWRVELAPPRATASAGVTEELVKSGTEVTAIGNRSQDENERRMKAVRLTIGGKNYDVYPSRAADI